MVFSERLFISQVLLQRHVNQEIIIMRSKFIIAALVMSVFLLPTLYVWIASERDVLPTAEGTFEEGEHVD